MKQIYSKYQSLFSLDTLKTNSQPLTLNTPCSGSKSDSVNKSCSVDKPYSVSNHPLVGKLQTISKLQFTSTLFLLCTLFYSCSNHSSSDEISVNRIEEAPINIDGVPNEADWQRATHLTQFVNPWNPRYQSETDLRLLWNGHELYFCFTVKEETLQLASVLQDKHEIIDEDRVELFFSPSLPLSTYYALEFDAIGRVLDYKAEYPKKFDESWNTKNKLQADGRLTADGFCVEGRISKALLNEMTNSHEKTNGHKTTDGQKEFYFGAYRGDLDRDEAGNFIYEWLCLRDPKLPEPDFHVNGTFCKLVLK